MRWCREGWQLGQTLVVVVVVVVVVVFSGASIFHSNPWIGGLPGRVEISPSWGAKGLQDRLLAVP